MRAFEVRGGGIDGLVQVERPEPSPGPGEALVAVRAASLNYRDLMVAEQARRPRVPLSDGAGEVVAVGPGVTTLRPGDRVATAFFPAWLDGELDDVKRRSALGGAADGVLAERLALPAAGLVRVPGGLSYEEAATLPCAAVTAWVGLVEYGRLRPGETVLAMGTGGVSVFALQLAKQAGARVILTSSDDAKLARGRALGADGTINYRTTPAWDERARALTDGRGVDHILEVGGAATLPTSLRALRDGGHLSVVGLLSGAWPDWGAVEREARGLRVDHVYVGSVRHFEAMNAAIAASGLRPVVDRVFPFDEARRAYEHLRSGRHFGKVVIRIGEAA
jgi:NADPH:quinone reductase-like Zn-dependent oxidoreductase